MRNSLLLFFSIIFSSCGNPPHEDYHSFGDLGWSADSIVEFKYSVADTIKKYDLSLKIRHTVEYEFQNLFLFLGGGNKDTIEIILANKNGKWLGSGVSSIRELEYVFDTERVFSKKGDYKLRLEQAMRYGPADKIENLEHILDVGLIVSEHND
ncbi:MAG: gliding motility lipoprotein GldH [Bacteroidota bacterium]|nr:gliding motility lipoprotein GldH [Bacteroidota bacterium]